MKTLKLKSRLAEAILSVLWRRCWKVEPHSTAPNYTISTNHRANVRAVAPHFLLISKPLQATMVKCSVVLLLPTVSALPPVCAS